MSSCRAIFVLMALSVLAIPVVAADIAAANAAYESGDFATAEAGYRELVERQPPSAGLYYNLGCALARQGKLGEAALAFRRCLHLDPRHTDAQDNLEWVRAHFSDLPESDEAPRDVLARLAAIVPEGPALLAAVALEWLALIVFFISRRAINRRVWMTTAAVLAGTAVLLAAGPLFGMYLRASEDRAIVTAQRAEARSGPGAQYPLLFTAHVGYEVRLQEERDSWSRVRTPNGLAGWIPSDAVRPVRIPLDKPN